MTRRHLRNFICATAAVLALVGIFGEHLRAYTLLGYKWGTNQVLYYVNAQNNYLSDAVATAAIQSAASAWTAQTGANFQFVYAGTTSGSSFTDNHKNEVFFRSDSTSPGGETYWWADANGNLVDADISFNQGRYVFTADGLPCSGAIPLQDFATHEFGHALGLRHSGAVDATMYANFPGWCDTSWRSLSSDDISGIQAMYSGGPAPTIPTAPSSLTVSRNASSPTSTLYLTWNDRSSNESGFTIQRSLDGLLYLKVTDVAVNVTSFTDQSLLPGIQYYYRVAAYNGVGTSSFSNVAGAVTDVLSSLLTSTSPDGTLVPTAAQIVDSQSAVWTIGAGSAILRNGSPAAGGYGSKILWSGGTIYVFGTDSHWWKWLGNGWANIGTTQPGAGTGSGTGSSSASPDGTLVPTVSQIVDSQGAVWTIGSGAAILRNGVLAASGYGSKILWSGGVIYVFGTDSNWWRWSGSGWSNVGGTQPNTGSGSASANATSPDGTLVPVASQIIDGQGAVWTIGSGAAILRNGVLAASGYGSKILWSGGTIYVLGTDSNWWKWLGGGWTNVGGAQPGTTGASPDGTTVPTAAQIIDSQGAAWTIGVASTILRDGAWAAGGMGSRILWSGGTIYVFGVDSNWWRWSGGGWTNVGQMF